MNAEQYRAVIGWFNARPAAKKALRLVSRSAVALVYLLYLGMLAWLAWHRMGQLWPALVVPASRAMSLVLSRNAATMASTVSLALPKHMLVFSKKNSGFSTSA